MRNETIRRIMTENPKFLFINDSISVAIDYFRYEKFHHLPIVGTDKRLLGVLSVTDVVIYLQKNSLTDANQSQVQSVMNTNVQYISIDSDLRTASEKLSSGKFHSLPVVGQYKELLGIVTSTDLIKHMLDLIPRDDGSIHPIRIETIQTRLKVLEEVRQAAKSYLRTGHGGHEHRMLLEKLAASENRDANL